MSMQWVDSRITKKEWKVNTLYDIPGISPLMFPLEEFELETVIPEVGEKMHLTTSFY